MKTTPDEKLFDLLENVDSDLLGDAMEVDTPEKLAAYKNRSRKPQPIWLRTAAVAACAAVLLGVFLLKDGDPVPEEEIHLDASPSLGSSYAPTKPGTTPTTPPAAGGSSPNWNPGGVTIQSADMLNYYGAIYLLGQQSGAAQTAANFGGGIQLLNSTQPPQNTAPLPDETEPYPSDTQGPPPTVSTEPTTPTEPVEDPVYYEFDPGMTIFVTKVYFFQVRIDENSYLADKIGTGIADVVISDAVWDDYMITFKNGDRYYSCLTNGYGAGHMQFSTHKFIDGYQVVKNFQKENTAFHVSFGLADQVEQIEEGYSTRTILSLASETYVTEVNASFTIDELEAYFNKPVEA